VFLWAHSADLGRPSALAGAFDPALLRSFFAMGGEGLRCQGQGIGQLVGLTERPTGCDEAIDKMLIAPGGKGNVLGKLAAKLPHGDRIGTYAHPDGTFRSGPPPKVQVAEVQNARCFQTRGYSVGDRGLHAVTEQPEAGETVSLPRYLGLGDAAAGRVMQASPAGRDAAILDYFKSRKTLGEVIHRFFGDPGLQVAAGRFAGPEHQAAIALLRARLGDAGFASGLNAVERAELELLAAAPQDFISCIARRGEA
jgi:hypothetical protein